MTGDHNGSFVLPQEWLAGDEAQKRVSEPTVSINVPCYHQLSHARRAVDSMLAQSFADFEVTLLDDGASDEYRSYVESLGDPRVRYCRNAERLGAMGNMFAAIESGRGHLHARLP